MVEYEFVLLVFLLIGLPIAYFSPNLALGCVELGDKFGISFLHRDALLRSFKWVWPILLMCVLAEIVISVLEGERHAETAGLVAMHLLMAYRIRKFSMQASASGST